MRKKVVIMPKEVIIKREKKVFDTRKKSKDIMGTYIGPSSEERCGLHIFCLGATTLQICKFQNSQYDEQKGNNGILGQPALSVHASASLCHTKKIISKD